MKYEVIGIWIGLSVGLAFVAITLYLRIKFLMSVKLKNIVL
jgi:hypothetical protein